MVSKTVKAKVGQKINYKVIKDGFKTENGTIDVTSDMDTNVSIETPSTQYSIPDDIFSVNITQQCPPIIKIKDDFILPDDMLFEKKNLILAPKGQYIIPNENRAIVRKNSGFSLKYNCNSNQGIVDGFDANGSYIDIDYTFPSSFNSCKLIFKGTLNDVTSGHNSVFGHNHTSDLVSFLVRNTSKFSCYNNGWTEGTTTLLVNRLYWFGIIFDGSSYKGYLLKDNNYNYTIDTLPTFDKWALQWSITADSSMLAGKKFNIGYNIWSTSEYFKGSIDLNGCQIEVDNEIVWKPQISDYSNYFRKYGNTLIDDNNIINGFDSNSYTRFSLYLPKNMEKFEFYIKATYQETNNSGSSIFSTTQGNNMIYISSDNHLATWIGNYNATNYQLSTGSTYWFRGIYTTSNGFELYGIEDNGQSLTDIMSKPLYEWNLASEVTTKFLSPDKIYTFYLGRHWNSSNSQQYLKGNLDLNNIAIFINDILYWKPIGYNRYDYFLYEVLADTIDKNGRVVNFNTSTYNGVKKYLKIPYGTLFHIEFQTGDDVKTQQQLFTSIRTTLINSYIIDGQFKYWSTDTSVPICEVLPNTYYKLDWIAKDNTSFEIIIKNYNDEIIHQSTQLIAYNEAEGICLGNHYNSTLPRPFFGYIDLSQTYITPTNREKMYFLKSRCEEMDGCLDKDFEDLYNEEQSVKLYNTVYVDENTLTITNDKINDENVLYSQYIDNITIPSREKQFTYNIDDEVWEEI